MNDSGEQTYSHLSHFMNLLKTHGFQLGVDHYINVQQMIAMQPDTLTPDQLKLVFCPIIASNAKEQALFYRLFDGYFKHHLSKATQEQIPASTPKAIKSQAPSRPLEKWIRYLIIPVVLILTICMINKLFVLSEIDMPKAAQVQKNVSPATDQHGELEKITISFNDVPQVIIPPTFYQKYGLALKWLATILPFLLFLIFTWLRLNQRQVILEKHEQGKMPSSWFQTTFQAPNINFLRSKRFYESTKQLRQRLQSNITQLDIDATVDTSVRAFGCPILCYKHLTRPPEYLVLIQVNGNRDHFAGFSDSLYLLFKNEDILVNRYFFYNDPRICFQDDHDTTYPLEELISHYHNCRLFIYTQGDHFLDPFTGNLEVWLEDILQFQNRALFTPTAASQWGLREVKLSRFFIVLPALMDGLYAVVNYFEYPHKYRPKNWMNRDNETISENASENIQALKKYLSPASFRWLCACAIYPELHWHLTIRLACEFIPSNELTEFDIIQFIRLPWFIDGTIPDHMRHALIHALPSTDQKKVREIIFKVLEENDISEGDPGFDLYTLTMALQKWSLSYENKRRKKYFYDQLSRVPKEAILQNYVLIRLLDTIPRSPLLFFLPRRFYNRFFEGRLPVFGLKTSFRLLRTLLFMCLIFFFIPEPEPYHMPESRPIVSFELVKIKAGEFMMGSPKNEPGRDDDETLHPVRITKDYYIQTTEVTQGQWKAVMGKNPSYFSNCGDDCPVEQVSWNSVQEFIQKLNAMNSDMQFRLPTEAEWEYAARAGSQDALYTGPIQILGQNNAPALDPIAWYGGNSCVTYEGGWGCTVKDYSEWKEKQYECSHCGTHPVAQKQPNKYGLYDMLGNVWEWTRDGYDDYPSDLQIDPTGSSDTSRLACRGGAWNGFARGCRLADRDGDSPAVEHNELGCRLVAVSPSSAK
ncbi:MAG: formylglycine-generating enzyme family protein, partial [Candidatus Magnetomorum sp.]|nr:formylglycine-generating enzyme family protein [Candidatus Magnetomorum sp.]